MNILDFSTDLLIYILSFCKQNRYNLLLTCKKFHELSYGILPSSRRGWVSYTLTENMYKKGLAYSIQRDQKNTLVRLLDDIERFTDLSLDRFHYETIGSSILHDNFRALRLLTKGYGVDPSYPKSMYFLKACKYGRLEIVKYLAKDDRVEVNSTDVIGCSGLILASEHGHYGVVKFLIGLPIFNLYNTLEYSAYIAQLNGHTKISNLLSGFLSYSP